MQFLQKTASSVWHDTTRYDIVHCERDFDDEMDKKTTRCQIAVINLDIG